MKLLCGRLQQHRLRLVRYTQRAAYAGEEQSWACAGNGWTRAAELTLSTIVASRGPCKRNTNQTSVSQARPRHQTAANTDRCHSCRLAPADPSRLNQTTPVETQEHPATRSAREQHKQLDGTAAAAHRSRFGFAGRACTTTTSASASGRGRLFALLLVLFAPGLGAVAFGRLGVLAVVQLQSRKRAQHTVQYD